MNRVKFAVIGCGAVSGYLHLPAISSLTDKAELAAIVDIDEKNLALNKEKYPQAQAFRDYRLVMTDPTIQAVVIATRADTHAEIAEAAFTAGKHVLLEKPPAHTAAVARKLLERQSKTGLICAVNFILRYSEGFRQMMQWLRAGEIGELRAVRLVSDWWGADHRGNQPGRGLRLLSVDGSIIVGEGIHHVDLVRWFTASEYDRICCLGTSIAYKPYPDHQAMIATMRNGNMVNIESSHGYGFSSKEPLMDRQAHLIGEGGVIKWCETDGNRLSLYGKNRTEHVTISEGKQSKLLYEDFIASCLQNQTTPTLPTLADGVAAMEAVERAQQVSAQQF